MKTTILGQKSSSTTFSDISLLMKKACMIKLKICMCWLGCQLNTSMILKAIILMNTWKIRWMHGHPLVFYFTRFDQITHKARAQRKGIKEQVINNLRLLKKSKLASIRRSSKTLQYHKSTVGRPVRRYGATDATAELPWSDRPFLARDGHSKLTS